MSKIVEELKLILEEIPAGTPYIKIKTPSVKALKTREGSEEIVDIFHDKLITMGFKKVRLSKDDRWEKGNILVVGDEKEGYVVMGKGKEAQERGDAALKVRKAWKEAEDEYRETGEEPSGTREPEEEPEEPKKPVKQTSLPPAAKPAEKPMGKPTGKEEK